MSQSSLGDRHDKNFTTIKELREFLNHLDEEYDDDQIVINGHNNTDLLPRLHWGYSDNFRKDDEQQYLVLYFKETK